MGEGVDPTEMCQSLVDKVAQSKQLAAITNPELLVLFEDWLEELEGEVLGLFKARGPLTGKALAEDLGLSTRGANFLLSKIEKKGKLKRS
jgi:DNA-binding MarR family transcriptional regulator